ncbi:MAG: histidine kinase [Natronomonas sp.]
MNADFSADPSVQGHPAAVGHSLSCWAFRDSPMSDLPPSLSGFIDEAEVSEKTLLLLNRTEPEPFVDLLSKAFEKQSVTVTEKQIPEGTDNLVCLIEDGQVVATTPLSELAEAFLLVNVDRYRTGTRQSDLGSFPDVLTGLDDVEFVVEGYPHTDREKLLLVLISRFIEHRALANGSGELHSTFQRLSRLDDEYGTRTMYERLGESDVETHVYGVRDDPAAVADIDVTVHDGMTEEYRRSWVVVFTPDSDTDDHVALVAIEIDRNVWRSVWTYDVDRTERIRSYMRQRF